MFDKGYITNTRLYLSKGAEEYLLTNYKREELPKYSRVIRGDISIVHVQLGRVHLIEGSHNCYLWIYKKLHSSAVVFDYDETNVGYYTLTKALDAAMGTKGCPAVARIQHNPSGFSWQQKAIEELNRIGINVKARDVMSNDASAAFKRLYGI